MDLDLDRLDDNLWEVPLWPQFDTQDSGRVVRVQTPSSMSPAENYRLSLIVSKAMQSIKAQLDARVEKGILLQIAQNGSEIDGRWQIKLVRPSSGTCAQFWQSIPMSRTLCEKKVLVLEVSRAAPGLLPARMEALFEQVLSCDERVEIPLPSIFFDPDVPLFQKLERAAFSDPFTQLATKAFQTIEPYIVAEIVIQGSYRFVLTEQNRLELVKIGSSNFSETEKAQNRKTVQAFLRCVIEEYGQEHLDYLQFSYGFNFEEIYKQGLPLLPDHVYKVNIGVNNIEILHLQQLYEKILKLHKSGCPPLDKLLASFCLRELRGLKKLMSAELTPENINQFLQKFLGASPPKSVKLLQVEQFNSLAAILIASAEERERAYTGRKISHLPIMGYKTMGKTLLTDPARNLCELMHVYADLEKTEEWFGFYELIAHVVAKKELFSAYPPSAESPDKPHWRVGHLIPGPKAASGEMRWYYVDSVTDDNEGDVNYVLLPACELQTIAGKPPPFIKLYRSTVSDQDALDAIDSIAADFNPYGSPGSVNPWKGDGYELPYFLERTIPIWVGYLLLAEKLLKEDDKREQAIAVLSNAIQEYKKSHRHLLPRHRELLSKLMGSQDPHILFQMLYREAERMRELPSHKINQDILFCGHSLGGTLAQFGMNYFGVHQGRIPTPGCDFVCYSCDSPSIDTKHDREFMQFGKKHKEVICALGQKWKIFHLFEYGDMIPLAGESHLGTTDYNPEEDCWLTVDIRVYKPIEHSENLAILIPPTHGRRFGLAKENSDYEWTSLTPRQLAAYDHSWKLSPELLEVFGYPSLISPKLVEISRRILSLGSRPLLYLMDKIHDYTFPERVLRDSDGVFFCRYVFNPSLK